MVLAVALGVAVVLAIELAGDAAAGSFRSSIETLTGNADLEVTAIGGVPDRCGRRAGNLAVCHSGAASHRRLRSSDNDEANGSAHRTRPCRRASRKVCNSSGDNSGRPTISIMRQTKTASGSAIIWERSAGGKIRLQINDQPAEYAVRGVLKDSGDSGGLVLMDIATAQRALNRLGRVDRVLLKVPPTRSRSSNGSSGCAPALPAGVELRREGSQTNENRRMLSAFRWNLRILSYVALVVGAFLIFNTISVSVVRRRPEIGIVRALGASRIGCTRRVPRRSRRASV